MARQSKPDLPVQPRAGIEQVECILRQLIGVLVPNVQKVLGWTAPRHRVPELGL